MKKSKMPMQAHNNGLGHWSDIKALYVCAVEVMLFLQIIWLCSLLVKRKLHNCNEGHLFNLALKRILTDKSIYHKQNIQPAFLNRALTKN